MNHNLICQKWKLLVLFWTFLLALLGNIAYAFVPPLPKRAFPTTYSSVGSKPFTTTVITSASADHSVEDTPPIPKPQSTTPGSLPLKIGSFYSLLGFGLWNLVRIQCLQPHEAMIGCGLLWLGFVLAISFTEAWVKFKAPFLPRHYGLDVGRTVFPVLNAIETAFCGTLWSLRCFSKTGTIPLAGVS
jgi:hypothetical protein